MKMRLDERSCGLVRELEITLPDGMCYLIDFTGEEPPEEAARIFRQLAFDMANGRASRIASASAVRLILPPP